ncbi:porin family protein [Spirosoma endbachense]|uniref:Outer membrane beta-barrel protein n=1 Tax=Spirosoma endbachense TaxID=2666025 RepID=A0A6P1W6R6_9BACT|nr:outer membrane beta-barrel protein [Spirosoma endbachense]QHV99406.1 outer membrane beta-barrel protein [Spirosoma endbachense]
MKKLFYIVLLVMPGNLLAQSSGLSPFSPGAWQIGLKSGYSPGSSFPNRFSTQLQLGYFVGNRWSVGLETSWVREWRNSPVLTSVGVGPRVHYQLTNSKLSPYLAASYQVGKQWLDSLEITYKPRRLTHSVSLTPGLSWQLSSKLRLDLSYRFEYYLSYRFNRTSYQEYALSRYFEYYQVPQLGITYFLGRKP